MIPSKNRIKKRKEFELVFHEGKTFLERFFLLKEKDNVFNFPRFAIVVPIKTERSAVKRNKVKRLYSEVVREKMKLIKKNIDIILIIKKEGKEKTYHEINQEVERVFKRIKLI